MALVLSDDGAGAILKAYFNNAWPAGGKNLSLKLFTNNFTPNANGSETVAAFTEASGAGYAAITLTNGSWTVSTVSTIVQAAFAKQTFTFNAALGATVYGYYIVDADANLVYAERAASVFTPTVNGDYYEVTPIIKFSTGTPA